MGKIAQALSITRHRKWIMPLFADGDTVSSFALCHMDWGTHTPVNLPLTVYNLFTALIAELSRLNIRMIKESHQGKFARFYIHKDDLPAYRDLLKKHGLIK